MSKSNTKMAFAGGTHWALINETAKPPQWNNNGVKRVFLNSSHKIMQLCQPIEGYHEEPIGKPGHCDMLSHPLSRLQKRHFIFWHFQQYFQQTIGRIPSITFHETCPVSCPPFSSARYSFMAVVQNISCHVRQDRHFASNFPSHSHESWSPPSNAKLRHAPKSGS